MNNENSSLHVSKAAPPALPKRALFASIMSAVLAALCATIVWMGALNAPDTESFAFSRATNLANGEERRAKSFLLPAVQDAAIKVVIVGHTGQLGDVAANETLSLARAEKLAGLATEMGIENDRIVVIGVGGSDPAERRDNQSDRAYQASLSRAEITLQVRQ